jgi:hypothetical protein
MKSTINIILLLSIFTTAYAEEKLYEKKKLGMSLDVTYMSRYMTKGREGYGKQGGFFETVSFDLFGTGFGVAFGHQAATKSGYVDKQRFNYTVYYANSLFKDERYQTNFNVSWTYKDYYGRARNIGNTQEWIVSLIWPNLLPIKNLAPYYTAYYECPAGSSYKNRDISGWVHLIGLSYGLKIPDLPNPLRLTADMAYNDGFCGPTKDHDWSYATLGVSTKFDISKNLSFVPGLYQQLSMDKSYAERDVLYCKISLKYVF